MSPHIALLVNPAAGRRRAAAIAVRLKEALRSAGARVHVYAGRSAADSRRLARLAVSDHPDVLVAVGGDGLVHQALQGVVGSGVPLAVVPAGSGNDVARAFGVRRSNVRDLAQAILAGRTRPSDVVRLTLPDGTRRYYMSVLACGFDARVNERVNNFRFGMGRAGYLFGIVAELRTFAPVDFEVEVDGRTIAEPGMLVAVGNTDSYGGGLKMCAGAEPDDGLLDVVLMREAPLSRFVLQFPRLLNGSHLELEEVRRERGATVTIRGEAGVAYADGERMGPPTLTCQVVPKSVEMLEPTS
ncbi:diacylglycerol kinase family protein [Nocardiopsis sp. MG754419]|uniref:diacylglycerol/lipid kinase family protein n=1 Tax=Nocardiopsis sp. MG754419 TaxID=2259865 RepID=UPI001BA4CEF7|nr:YegS/Rv2252/BmrU family lipid kinase [Nocardiopsis sp. MG754419]MBR8742135.1 lipid kinase [Nocardiopsis sp. MG754419]